MLIVKDVEYLSTSNQASRNQARGGLIARKSADLWILGVWSSAGGVTLNLKFKHPKWISKNIVEPSVQKKQF